MANVAVVDDHPVVREGIKRLLIEADVARSVLTFSSAEELLRALGENQRVDVCLLDLSLPGLGGFEALVEMRTRWPDIPVIVLTAQPASSVAMRTLSAGARGFVSKGQDPQDLFSAIEKVLAGGRAIDPSYIDLILSSVDSDNSQLPHERLSNREFDILGRLASGESIQSIASSLCISPKTVSTYRRRCLEKMGFDRNSQLTEYVLTYLQLPQPAA
jgi:DNA-binding NarL/FixJ family response regulator